MRADIDTFREHYRELTKESNLDSKTSKVAMLMLDKLSLAELRLAELHEEVVKRVGAARTDALIEDTIRRGVRGSADDSTS